MTGEAINAAGIAFKQALIEATLNAGLAHHLGYAPGAERPEPTTNQRNGFTSKTVLTGDGKLHRVSIGSQKGPLSALNIGSDAILVLRSVMFTLSRQDEPAAGRDWLAHTSAA